MAIVYRVARRYHKRKSEGDASVRLAPNIGVVSGLADNRNVRVVSKSLDFGLAR
jgi:hypothetical protein